MKYAIFLPFLGYLILFNQALVEHITVSARFVPYSYFELLPCIVSTDALAPDSCATHYRLYVYYFGGLMLGLGQILYFLFCPSIIQKHGDAAVFVAAERIISSPTRLKAMGVAIAQRDIADKIDLAKYEILWGAESEGVFGDKFLSGNPILVRTASDEGEQNEDADLEAALRYIQSTFAKPWTAEQIMTEWFVRQKGDRPVPRLAVSLLYCTGLLVLAIPGLDTFISIVAGMFN